MKFKILLFLVLLIYLIGVSSATVPAISDLVNTTPHGHTCIMTWNTDIITDNTVKYSTNSNMSSPMWSHWLNDTTSINYITLYNLQLNTTYYWQAFSHNASDSSNSTVHNFVALPNIIRKNTSVEIIWDTNDSATTGQIEYGLDTNYGNLTDVDGLSYWHPIEITNLTQGTTYYYRIREKNYKGENEVVSNNFTFTTRTTTELENVIKAARIGNDLPKTYYVKNGGSNSNNGSSLDFAWETMHHAASVAEAGDVIYVVDGSYTGYVDFGWYVGNSGIPEAPITMKAYNGTPDLSAGNFVLRANYITVDGFVVHDVSGKSFDLKNNNNINILNCEAYNTTGSDGIYLWDASYVIIDNCYVHNTGWNGIGIKPSVKYPFGIHHVIVKNTRVIDIWYHNFFDVQSDYLTIKNCTAYNTPGNEPGDEILGAPFRISIYHSVINNCSGENGNNGVKTAETSKEFVIINSIFPDYGFNSNTIAGYWGNMILYNNSVNYSDYGMYLYAYSDNLIDANNATSQEINGYTYGFTGDVNANVTIRNEKDLNYKVHASVSGSTNVTVEYTNGNTFSVDGSGEYTTYTWSSGLRTINVSTEWSPIENRIYMNSNIINRIRSDKIVEWIGEQPQQSNTCLLINVVVS